ncbi:unnamed protein product [Linum trigynum]|uniref:F-box domain-containing protein n=1 Tax=Linum trigynum TaxID=586398 RepID=A0AAV2D3E2_9ROSI
MAGDHSSSGTFSDQLTEDILTNILLRLPNGSCIARFRCVCRSWRNLLSDPQFILRILRFPKHGGGGDVTNRSSSPLQILITGDLHRHLYSLHSYDTLRPVSTGGGDLPSSRQPAAFTLIVAGSCDGIFCIVDMNPTGGAPSVTLWNPATSETKFLPDSAGPPRRSLFDHEQVTGFGFDPRTNDYKVVRVMFFHEMYDDCNDYDLTWEERNTRLTYAEVYSLRNDSWKRLNFHEGDRIRQIGNFISNVYPQQRGDDDSRDHRHRCHWFYACFEDCFTLSFDMTEEVLDYASLALPRAFHGDSLIALMGCFADSWTRLYDFRPPAWQMDFLMAWKEEGMCICSRESRRGSMSLDPGEVVEETDGVYVFSPATGEYIGERIETRARTRRFQAHVFTPTQVSLSDLV